MNTNASSDTMRNMWMPSVIRLILARQLAADLTVR